MFCETGWKNSYNVRIGSDLKDLVQFLNLQLKKPELVKYLSYSTIESDIKTTKHSS